LRESGNRPFSINNVAGEQPLPERLPIRRIYVDVFLEEPFDSLDRDV